MKQISIPKGTRDFLPLEVAKRNYIINEIRKKFELYGFQPIETPALENLSTLTGKYGEEGDQLLFKILNNRLNENTEKDLIRAEFNRMLEKNVSSEYITERALRYDLTVPLARFVVMNRNEIVVPFKRYQIAPVWRGDKPQKGRYREFFQCDADIIGSDSLLNEIELLELFRDVYKSLNIKVDIKVNNRKILSALCRCIDEESNFLQIVTIIDKLDKIGQDKAKVEFSNLGLNEDKIQRLFELLKGNDLQALKKAFENDPVGITGVEELTTVLDSIGMESVSVDFSLARGITYYTGLIYEVVPKDVRIGSIASGGRYDNLTSLFGSDKYSGVGISFGIDRTYDVLNELNKWPKDLDRGTDVLFVNFGKPFEKKILSALKSLRENNLSCEYYPDEVKMNKQMKFANQKKISFVIFWGEEESFKNLAKIKDMRSGAEFEVDFLSLVDVLKARK